MPEADRPKGILAEPNPNVAPCWRRWTATVYARHPVRTHLVTDADDVVRSFALRHAARSRCRAGRRRRADGGHHPGPLVPDDRDPPRASGPLPGALRDAPRIWDRAWHGPDHATCDPEVGAPRILLAAAVSAITSHSGSTASSTGWPVARPAAIDGPADYTIAPYNNGGDPRSKRTPDGAARRLPRAGRAGCHHRCQTTPVATFWD